MGANAALLDQTGAEDADPSVAAFEAVQAAIARPRAPSRPQPRKDAPATRRIPLADGHKARVSRSARGVRFDLGKSDFADWMEQEASVLLNELYRRWQDQRG